MLFISCLIHAQQPLPPQEEAFRARNYAGYLAALEQELAVGPRGTVVPFARVGRVAISLEKTAGWDGDAGERARVLLQAAPGSAAQLAALRSLFAGDAAPICAVFLDREREPDFPNGSQVSKLCHEHGLPAAADVLLALTRDLSGERVLAWARIPAAMRPAVDQCMLARYPVENVNRRSLVEIALRLATKPDANGPPASTFVDLALLFGKDTNVVTVQSARALLAAGKKAEAGRVANWLVREKPADPSLPGQAVAVLREAGDVPGALALFHAALARVPEPDARITRLDYLASLRALADHPAVPAVERLHALQASPDPLLAGDARLIDGKFADAAAAYRLALTDEQATVPACMAAWWGLLEADPDAALTGFAPLCDRLAALPAAERTPLLNWLAHQLARAVQTDLPPASSATRFPTRPPVHPLREAPDATMRLAAAFDRLLALDPAACLRPAIPRALVSVRGAVALVYARAGQDAKAADILQRVVTYLVPPPPGGWREPTNAPAPDADQPRPRTTPEPGETDRLYAEVMGTLTHLQLLTNPQSTTTMRPPLNTAYLQRLADALCAPDMKVTPQQVQPFAQQFALALVALDPLPLTMRTDRPPPPTRAIDPAALAPIAAAFRQVVAHATAEPCLRVLTLQALAPAWETASSPALLDCLYDMSTACLDRVAQLSTDPRMVNSHVEILAQCPEGRPVYDLKPYGQKLRERYRPTAQ